MLAREKHSSLYCRSVSDEENKKFNNLDTKGAKVILGGEKHPVGDLHYRPTILTDLNSEMIAFKVYKTIKILLRFFELKMKATAT
jgi:hypothetical protein